jgi:type II secretory pathway component PulM
MISLTKRERWLAVSLAGIVGVGSVYAAVVKPAYHRIQTLERIIPEKQSELHALEAKSVEYLALCREFENFRTKAAARDASFQLLPYLESLIERHSLTKNIVAMAPDAVQVQPDYCETTVKVELAGVPLKQLLGFLKDIEASEVCTQIVSLDIRRNATDDALVDSTIDIRSPQGRPSPVAADIDRHP